MNEVTLRMAEVTAFMNAEVRGAVLTMYSDGSGHMEGTFAGDESRELPWISLAALQDLVRHRNIHSAERGVLQAARQRVAKIKDLRWKGLNIPTQVALAEAVKRLDDLVTLNGGAE